MLILYWVLLFALVDFYMQNILDVAALQSFEKLQEKHVPWFMDGFVKTELL